MNHQQQENKAMVKKALVHTALTAATIATFLSTEGRVNAHHGWSEYNNQQTLNLNGEIQNVSYGNPHTIIKVKTEDNKIWQAVLAPSTRMQRRGLPQGTLEVGQKVKLVGYPHLTDKNQMRAEQIVINNKTIELR